MSNLTHHFILKNPISARGWLLLKQKLGEEFEGRVAAEFDEGYVYAIFCDCESTVKHVRLLIP